MRNFTRTLLSIAWACSAGAAAFAGDLNPPLGPVAPTMKSLDTVEPRIPIGPLTTPGNADATYVITEPGSYYLTENLLAIDGSGILIEADDVTIDLMGFTVEGAFVTAVREGILTAFANPNHRITIRNGFLHGWGSHGIFLTGDGCVLEDLIITNCGRRGAWLGDRAVVRGCIFASNTFTGLFVTDDSVVEGCIADENDINGFHSQDGSVLTQCISIRNESDGFQADDEAVISECISGGNQGSGFEAENGLISDCIASMNAQEGIATQNINTRAELNVTGCLSVDNLGTGILIDDIDAESSLVAGCVVANNDSGGIVTTDRCSILNNNVYANGGDGIGGGDDCLIAGNLSYNNENGDGIRAENACRIVNNHVIGSGGAGIAADVDCTIERNSVALSGATGIFVDDRCLISGNNSENNGTQGIAVSGRECTIMNNRFANNGTAGIQLDGDRNFVFANFARDNAGNNYQAVSNNRFGPIVIPPLSGDIQGSNDPDVAGAGTTDPFANFSY